MSLLVAFSSALALMTATPQQEPEIVPCPQDATAQCLFIPPIHDPVETVTAPEQSVPPFMPDTSPSYSFCSVMPALDPQIILVPSYNSLIPTNAETPPQIILAPYITLTPQPRCPVIA